MSNSARRDYLVDKVSGQASKNIISDLPKGKCLVLVIDVMNNSMRDEGAMKKGMHYDISHLQQTERPMIGFIEKAKRAGVPCCYVQCIYDYKYIPDNMRNEFVFNGIPDVLNKKGTWGDQIIDTLPEPDYRLIKCQFSSFHANTFLFIDGNCPELSQYLLKTVDQDEEVKEAGGKIMEDYFKEAAENRNKANAENIDAILANGVVSLDTLLRSKGIDTLIFAGGSTDVCVDATVTAAAERGYSIILPIDLLASEDENKHWEYLDNMGFFKGKLTTSDNISF
ncbi:MAG: cysteine hydrolase [Oscillospiraceae bacterium]|nr:cysteine hydrolase [Oscillospiraceae bacterium]